MREETVILLLNNLLVLRGHIRHAHIKIQALEDVLNDLGGPHHARYLALVAQYEHDPRFSYPLEDIEGLRKALLQGQHYNIKWYLSHVSPFFPFGRAVGCFGFQKKRCGTAPALRGGTI